MKHHILLIDDDQVIRTAMKSFLQDEGFLVKTVATGEEGIALIKQNIIPFSLAIIDYHLQNESGKDVIKKIMSINPKFKIIGFSGDKANHVCLDSYFSGAINYIEKGTQDIILIAMIHRLCREYEIENKPASVDSFSENQNLIASVGMIGRSHALAEIARVILKAAKTNATILIRGEAGTGKELIAQAIHKSSKRSSRNFIAVNTGAITGSLIESELFGYEKGAFTGAQNRRLGKFQAAHGGTIFFDEIGEMSYDLQKVLLRVIQERKLTLVGSNDETPIDIRIIAATNAPLEAMIDSGKFRQDLFDRLNVIPVYAPPLRERIEDIPLLIKHFMNKMNAASGIEKEILEVVVHKIQENPPIGNIRGLENMIERLHTLAEGDKINLKTLEMFDNKKIVSNEQKKSASNFTKNIEMIRHESEEDEKKVILYALQEKKNITKAANYLEVTREYLRSRIRSLKINTDLINLKNNEGEL